MEGINELVDRINSLSDDDFATVVSGIGLISLTEVANTLGIGYHRVKMLKKDSVERTSDSMPSALPVPVLLYRK